MDYLTRDDAPFEAALWEQIDSAVVKTARSALTGRRFLPLYGPLGPGADTVKIDHRGAAEQLEEGIGAFSGRSYAQLPLIYEDFWFYWRDMAASRREGAPLDLSAVGEAALSLALREDELIFYGAQSLGLEGLLTAKGILKQKRRDWSKDENAFADVSAAMATLLQKRKMDGYTLLLSPDLYAQLQRIQPGTGLLESARIEKLLDGRLFHSPALKPGTAALVSARSQYMDLAVGQDIATAYLEAVDLNHHLRVLETVLPRIKDPEAIVLFQ